MRNRIYLTILLGLMMISLASAIPIFKFGDSDTTTYTNVITQISNSTDKWDNLDTPNDITGHQYWYNQSTRFFSWLSSFEYNYNQTTQFSNWLSGFLYNYNQTIASIYNYNMTVDSIYDYNQTQTADTTYAYNQSSPYDNFNYNMTTASIYNYNMTINSIYDYNQTSLYDYNMTIYGIYNYNQTTSFIYNYNQSESIWHYNQTINSAYDYNMTIDSIYNYNQTVAFIYNYNQSESVWHYNQTIYGEYNYNQTQTFTYDYNQSSPYDVFNYNMSDGNSGADGSYNSTYETWAYNQTIEDTTYHYNQSSPYDVFNYNMTDYGIYNYNQTLTFIYNFNQSVPFQNWLDGFLYNYNQTITSIYNYNMTVNSIYDYNQTSIYDYNMTVDSIYDYNMTIQFGDGSYNATYEEYTYNQSTPYDTFNYNQTIEDTTYHYNQSSPYDTYNYNMSDGVGTGNESFNQTLTDSLYAGIEWDYNQTDGVGIIEELDPVHVAWLESFLYNYNQTILSIYNYNMSSPYDTFNYNMTVNSIYDYNQTSLYDYNMTVGFTDTSYNITYETHINNLTLHNNTFWYNMSDGIGYGKAGDGDYLYNDTETMYFNISKLSTEYFNATQAAAIAGTIDGGDLTDTQHQDGHYDGKTFNFTEVAGSPGLDLRMNFTNIETFNRGVIRYKTDALAGNYPVIQVWDCDGYWEDYPSLAETKSFAIITQPVFDYSNHICEGVVQMRLYKSSNGNTNNHYYVDWVALSSGFGTPSGVEVDPYSYHRTDNINATGYNVSADYFIGDGSKLTGITGGNQTFNQSLTDLLYANIQWNYNQSSPYDTYNYNQSSPYDLFNYNQTATMFFYNLSAPFYTWLGSFLYNYNQTAPLMTYSYNQTAPAMTYEYNQTTPTFAVINQTCAGDNNYSYGYLNGQIQCRDDGLNGTASGGATKEFFSTALEGSVSLTVDGTWSGMTLTSSGYAYYKFYIPNDFNSLSEATIMVIPDATETIQWDIISAWGSVGESKTQNTDSLYDQTKAVTANTIQELDISGVLNNGTLSAGDYVSIKFDSDTTQYMEIGLRIKYT